MTVAPAFAHHPRQPASRHPRISFQHTADYLDHRSADILATYLHAPRLSQLAVCVKCVLGPV
jgi:hypothetical protein